jgi:hypothetical protein
MAEYDDMPRYVVEMVVAYAKQQEIEARKKPLTSAEKRRLKAVGQLPETTQMKEKRAFQKMLQGKGVKCGDVTEIDDAVSVLPADYYETEEYKAKYAAYEALFTKNCTPAAADELSEPTPSTA